MSENFRFLTTAWQHEKKYTVNKSEYKNFVIIFLKAREILRIMCIYTAINYCACKNHFASGVWYFQLRLYQYFWGYRIFQSRLQIASAQENNRKMYHFFFIIIDCVNWVFLILCYFWRSSWKLVIYGYLPKFTLKKLWLAFKN